MSLTEQKKRNEALATWIASLIATVQQEGGLIVARDKDGNELLRVRRIEFDPSMEGVKIDVAAFKYSVSFE